MKNREELAQQLLDNFNAFRDPKKPGYVSVDSILAMAKRGWSPNPAMNENIRLANELLRRPELMAAMDRHSSTGALDGLIDRQKLNMVIKGENYFKYKTDKELAGELLDHFDELKKRSGGSLHSPAPCQNRQPTPALAPTWFWVSKVAPARKTMEPSPRARE